MTGRGIDQLNIYIYIVLVLDSIQPASETKYLHFYKTDMFQSVCVIFTLSYQHIYVQLCDISHSHYMLLSRLSCQGGGEMRAGQDGSV